MKIYAHYPDGKLAITVPFQLEIDPIVGDLIEQDGSVFKVERRYFGITSEREKALFLTVSDSEEVNPVNDV